MKNIFMILCCVLLLFSCNQDDSDQEENVPECLKDTVSAIVSQPVQNPKAKIEKWSYNNQEVYFINAQNFPDGEIYVITIDCKETICTFGGFDGPENDCENWDKAEFIETIWMDPR